MRVNLFDSVYKSLGFERLVSWDGWMVLVWGERKGRKEGIVIWAKRSSRLGSFFFPLSFPGGRQETFLCAVSVRIFGR